jgi:hypothetical protein
MNALLIITTGQTDVQLITGQSRCEFDKKVCATLHDELERREADWSLGDAPAAKDEHPVSELPVSSFQICTPKLDAVLEHMSKHGLTLTHALILDTRRSNKGDPRLAGVILEKRVRAEFGILVWRKTFLEGDERTEDQSDPHDAVVRRQVVARIEEAVREGIQYSVPQRIVVAATGGMPAITALVEEVIQLHAGSAIPVELLEVSDGALANPPTRDLAIPRRSVPEPAESFRARRHALDLIERGDLLGAWGSVRHLDGDELEHRWTQTIEWLSCFAASLPIPSDCDIPVLAHKRMAVRAAIRVELALRSKDIPRAVHGTVAFFESALWDRLNEHVISHPTEKRRYAVNPAPPECLIRSDSLKNEEENRKRPFERKTENGDTWYRVIDDDICGIRLAKHYLKNDWLEKLGKAVSKVRELRNDVAHNEPTPRLMADASDKMANENLWSRDSRFLTMPLVQNVLRDLGEKDPECLCDGLIATVRSRLLDLKSDN